MSREAATWSEVRRNPSYPSHSLAVADETFKVFSAEKEIASKTKLALQELISGAIGHRDCRIDGFSVEYTRGTLSFQCGVDRRPGLCFWNAATLNPEDCHLLSRSEQANRGFHQSGFFTWPPKSGEAPHYISVASTFDPPRRPAPWRVEALLHSNGNNDELLASYNLVEQVIPNGQDILKWLTVIHPPLVFCEPGRDQKLACWVDRESAYFLDSSSRKLAPIFHPADAVPLIGTGYAAVKGTTRYYIISLQ